MSYHLRMNNSDIILKSIVSKELKISLGSTKTIKKRKRSDTAFSFFKTFLEVNVNHFDCVPSIEGSLIL